MPMVERPAVAPAVRRAVFAVRQAAIIQFQHLGEVAHDAKFVVHHAHAALDGSLFPVREVLMRRQAQPQHVTESRQAREFGEFCIATLLDAVPAFGRLQAVSDQRSRGRPVR